MKENDMLRKSLMFFLCVSVYSATNEGGGAVSEGLLTATVQVRPVSQERSGVRALQEQDMDAVKAEPLELTKSDVAPLPRAIMLKALYWRERDDVLGVMNFSQGDEFAVEPASWGAQKSYKNVFGEKQWDLIFGTAVCFKATDPAKRYFDVVSFSEHATKLCMTAAELYIWDELQAEYKAKAAETVAGYILRGAAYSLGNPTPYHKEPVTTQSLVGSVMVSGTDAKFAGLHEGIKYVILVDDVADTCNTLWKVIYSTVKAAKNKDIKIFIATGSLKRGRNELMKVKLGGETIHLGTVRFRGSINARLNFHGKAAVLSDYLTEKQQSDILGLPDDEKRKKLKEMITNDVTLDGYVQEHYLSRVIKVVSAIGVDKFVNLNMMSDEAAEVCWFAFPHATVNPTRSLDVSNQLQKWQAVDPQVKWFVAPMLYFPHENQVVQPSAFWANAAEEASNAPSWLDSPTIVCEKVDEQWTFRAGWIGCCKGKINNDWRAGDTIGVVCVDPREYVAGFWYDSSFRGFVNALQTDMTKTLTQYGYKVQCATISQKDNVMKVSGKPDIAMPEAPFARPCAHQYALSTISCVKHIEELVKVDKTGKLILDAKKGK